MTDEKRIIVSEWMARRLPVVVIVWITNNTDCAQSTVFPSSCRIQPVEDNRVDKDEQGKHHEIDQDPHLGGRVDDTPDNIFSRSHNRVPRVVSRGSRRHCIPRRQLVRRRPGTKGAPLAQPRCRQVSRQGLQARILRPGAGEQYLSSAACASAARESFPAQGPAGRAFQEPDFPQHSSRVPDHFRRRDTHERPDRGNTRFSRCTEGKQGMFDRPGKKCGKKIPCNVVNGGGKCAPGGTVRFGDLTDQVAPEHPAGAAGSIRPVLLYHLIHRRAVPLRKGAAVPFNAAGSRHRSGLSYGRGAGHSGVDGYRREPDVAACCSEFYEKEEEGGTGGITRQRNGDMVARAQPAVRTDGMLGLCLEILKKMHRAEVFSRIGLVNDGLAPARIALHREQILF